MCILGFRIKYISYVDHGQKHLKATDFKKKIGSHKVRKTLRKPVFEMNF